MKRRPFLISFAAFSLLSFLGIRKTKTVEQWLSENDLHLQYWTSTREDGLERHAFSLVDTRSNLSGFNITFLWRGAKFDESFKLAKKELIGREFVFEKHINKLLPEPEICGDGMKVWRYESEVVRTVNIPASLVA